MSELQLSESLFATAAGWEAMKLARALLATDKVLSSNWTAPVLKGVVQADANSYRSGLVIKSASDMENLCTCRDSRQWGKICAHSVAVGLHWLRSMQPTAGASGKAASSTAAATSSSTSAPRSATSPAVSKPSVRRVQRATAEGAGEPAEIFVILPPNLEAALAKGKVMVFFEGKWRGGRSPLANLPVSTAFHFSPEDTRLLDVIERLAEGDTPGALMLDTAQFSDVLEVLAGHPRIAIGRTTAVTVRAEPRRVPLEAFLGSNGEITLALGPGFKPPTVVPGRVLWAAGATTFEPLGLPSAWKDLLRNAARLPRSRVPQFLTQELPVLEAGCDVTLHFRLEDFVFAAMTPEFRLSLSGGLTHLLAKLECAYGGRVFVAGSSAADQAGWLPDPDQPTRYSTRDLPAEQAALLRLLRAGFAGNDAQGRMELTGQNAVLTFFARLYPKLQREWKVTLEERLERTTASQLERVEPRFEVTPSGDRWFDLEMTVQSSGGEKFSPADIQRLILSGQSHSRLRNGKIALIDTGAVEDFQEALRDCAPQQHAKGYRIDAAQSGFLEATIRQNAGWKLQTPAAWRERSAQLRGEAKLTPPPLGDLETVLRPYQKHGVAWLGFLRAHGFGGVLADEMGLGKTLQTLAFLQSVKDAGGAHGPCLIVCPTSLVFNWAAEAKKFTPRLRVLALSGPQRHGLFEQVAQSDLVVTSYALIRRDAERYAGIEFDTVVLDEAQHIKNRQTQNAQAVKAIRAPHRLVLTGTPMENSVLDLWSVFDFLMPGYLGAAADFRERYEQPITREKSAEAQARLARRLRPFLLRRLKKDVAADLPARLEQVSFCDLTDEQATVYRQILDASRKQVLDAVGQQGLAKSRMVVLTALLRLRQVCCDLRLLKLEAGDDAKPVAASGKVEMFGELLEEVIDGGHRVLVFSQFTTMLGLLKERLAAEEIEYCYLDGSTTNRAEVVGKFQSSPQIPVFLISLKAGGVGLNLTGADTVIHFDPWWNPAVEDQATDRAHRIGQTRVVTSYKLITRGTVEEKILSLQQRKRAVIQATLGSEEQLSEALTWEEIQELLA